MGMRVQVGGRKRGPEERLTKGNRKGVIAVDASSPHTKGDCSDPRVMKNKQKIEDGVDFRSAKLTGDSGV